MTNFLELIKSRRSIRSYSDRTIQREDLDLCVEAGRYAPSACDSQPWKFIIIDNPKIRKELSENIFSHLYGMNSFAENAAAFIAIISEKTKFMAWLGEKLRNADFRSIDLGSACEHIVLQAQELGIGSCILGWFDEKKLKKTLYVPSKKKVELLIALGYPENNTELRQKKLKDKKDTVSYNKY
ncbi:MAG: nitroreductase family protein [Candidatus Omnitrophota bacterium]